MVLQIVTTVCAAFAVAAGLAGGFETWMSIAWVFTALCWSWATYFAERAGR